MAFNNASTAPIEQEYSNVIPFNVIKGGAKEKKIKYNKDGSINQSKCHKVAGKNCEVYAFRTENEIASMIKVLDKHIAEATNKDQRRIACRNKLLFLVGTNIGIRASDLRSVKWSFFFDKNNGELEFKDFYVLQPKKQRNSNKFVKLFFNQTVRTAINNYISEYPIENLDDYLFPSRKGEDSINEKTLCDIIKKTAQEAEIKQNIGSHSLRKTFGFWCWHQAKDKNKALVILQRIFNHSSTQVTMKYIGLLDDEIEDMFNSIDIGLNWI